MPSEIIAIKHTVILEATLFSIFTSMDVIQVELINCWVATAPYIWQLKCKNISPSPLLHRSYHIIANYSTVQGRRTEFIPIDYYVTCTTIDNIEVNFSWITFMEDCVVALVLKKLESVRYLGNFGEEGERTVLLEIFAMIEDPYTP